jgi:hypothetical protein
MNQIGLAEEPSRLMVMPPFRCQDSAAGASLSSGVAALLCEPAQVAA